jgi:hypothetical protein
MAQEIAHMNNSDDPPADWQETVERLKSIGMEV